ncbi:MAG: hypothetical protein Q7J27_13475 [Syntrophales bacterium]|nr:hypothetical protein [Syntrophales bacterium]
MIRYVIEYGYKRRYNLLSAIALLLFAFCAAVSLSSCAVVSPYTIDINYEPADTTPALNKNVWKLVLTVAKFNDLRQVKDKMEIGKVIKSDGTQIPIFPKFRIPSDAVTHAFKDYLTKAGNRLSTDTPDWDLKNDTINKEWGNIVIGGNIHEFEIVCTKEFPIRKYTAKVKFVAGFANVRKPETIVKITVESTPTVEHVSFSEQKIEEVMNEAMSVAIRRVFESEEINRIFIDAAKQID